MDAESSSFVNPMDVFSPDDYRRWNLDIRTDRVTKLFGGASEEYEAWRDSMVNLCSSQWLG